MTPETAREGIRKLPEAISSKPREWVYEDWPDLRDMKVFKNITGFDPYLQTR